MNIYGVKISEEQINAAVRSMRGTFTMVDVIHALCRAGVAAEGPVAARAADRLLQRERKAGRIRCNPNNKRQWLASEGLSA
jgi:hypothetical protein